MVYRLSPNNRKLNVLRGGHIVAFLFTAGTLNHKFDIFQALGKGKGRAVTYHWRYQD